MFIPSSLTLSEGDSISGGTDQCLVAFREGSSWRRVGGGWGAAQHPAGPRTPQRKRPSLVSTVPSPLLSVRRTCWDPQEIPCEGLPSPSP